jgi:hypothetical protein
MRQWRQPKVKVPQKVSTVGKGKTRGLPGNFDYSRLLCALFCANALGLAKI